MRLKRQQPYIAKQFCQRDHKMTAVGAVNHPMVVGQTQRQLQPRFEAFTSPNRLHPRLSNAQNSHFWRIDDGREPGATERAQTGNGKRTTAEVVQGQFFSAGFFCQLLSLFRLGPDTQLISPA